MKTHSGIAAVTLPWFLGVADRDQSWLEAAKHAAKQLVREAIGRRIGLYPFARTNLLGASSVVIVDGVERIGTQEMAALVDGCAYYGAKLILSGDRDGFRSMSRGVPFRAFCDRMPHASLGLGTTATPHPEPLAQLQAGDPRSMLADLAASDRLKVSKSAEESVATLVSDWWDHGGVTNPRQHLIVAASPAERLAIHRDIRDRRRQTGLEATETVILENGEECSAGDRIICLKSSKRYRVMRGQFGTVLGVSRRLDIVQVALDDGDVTTLPLATYKNLQVAYAVGPEFTVSTDHIYGLLGADRDTRQSAMAVMRAAGQTSQFYADTSRAGDDLEKLENSLGTRDQERLAIDVSNRVEPVMEAPHHAH